MRNTTLHYFEQQRRLLQEGLAEFTRQHPHQAQLLGIGYREITDPQLRALIDGVAFLNGLTAQRLDRIAPALTETLIRMAFPDYLRPVPALMPVIFTPQPEAMQATELPADTPFSTQSHTGETLHWRTQAPLTLLPLALTAQQFIARDTAYRENGHMYSASCSLLLTLSVTAPGVTLAALPLSSLTLNFTGEGEAPWQADDTVHRLCAGIRLTAGETVLFLPAHICQRLPLSHSAETGDTVSALLYHALWRPERHTGVMLQLGDVLTHCRERTFSLEFLFRELPPDPAVFDQNSTITLFSAVLTNCFPHQTEPLHITRDTNPHRICTDTHADFILHSVEEVTDISTLPSATVAQLYHETAGIPSRWYWQAVCADDGAVTHLNAIRSEPRTDGETETSGLWVLRTRVTQGAAATRCAVTSAVNSLRAEPLAYSASATQRPLLTPLISQPDPDALFMHHRHTRLSDLIRSPQGAAPLKALLTLYDRQSAPVLSRLIAAIDDVTSSTGVTVRFYQNTPLTLTGQHITVTLSQSAPVAGTAFFAALLEAVFIVLSDDDEFIQLTLRWQENVREAHHCPLRLSAEMNG